MSGVLETAASGVPLDVTKPTQLVTKLPMKLVDKVFFGLKVGLGGTAIFIGIAVVVLIVAAILRMVGIDITNLSNRAQSELGF